VGEAMIDKPFVMNIRHMCDSIVEQV